MKQTHIIAAAALVLIALGIGFRSLNMGRFASAVPREQAERVFSIKPTELAGIVASPHPNRYEPSLVSNSVRMTSSTEADALKSIVNARRILLNHPSVRGYALLRLSTTSGETYNVLLFVTHDPERQVCAQLFSNGNEGVHYGTYQLDNFPIDALTAPTPAVDANPGDARTSSP